MFKKIYTRILVAFVTNIRYALNFTLSLVETSLKCFRVPRIHSQKEKRATNIKAKKCNMRGGVRRLMANVLNSMPFSEPFAYKITKCDRMPVLMRILLAGLRRLRLTNSRHTTAVARRQNKILKNIEKY